MNLRLFIYSFLLLGMSSSFAAHGFVTAQPQAENSSVVYSNSRTVNMYKPAAGICACCIIHNRSSRYLGENCCPIRPCCLVHPDVEKTGPCVAAPCVTYNDGTVGLPEETRKVHGPAPENTFNVISDEILLFISCVVGCVTVNNGKKSK